MIQEVKLQIFVRFLVAPRQTAKAPEDQVSEGALQFILTGVLKDLLIQAAAVHGGA
jgi:hypothetical protein